MVNHLRVYLALPTLAQPCQKVANGAFVRLLSDPKYILSFFANRAGFTKMVLRACVGETGGNSSSTTMVVPLPSQPLHPVWQPRCQRASQSSSFESAEIGLFLPMPRKNQTHHSPQGVSHITVGKVSITMHVYRGCFLMSLAWQSFCLKLLLLVPCFCTNSCSCGNTFYELPIFIAKTSRKTKTKHPNVC